MKQADYQRGKLLTMGQKMTKFTFDSYYLLLNHGDIGGEPGSKNAIEP